MENEFSSRFFPVAERLEQNAAVCVGAAGAQPEGAAGDGEEAAGERANHQSSERAGQHTSKRPVITTQKWLCQEGKWGGAVALIQDILYLLHMMILYICLEPWHTGGS